MSAWVVSLNLWLREGFDYPSAVLLPKAGHLLAFEMLWAHSCSFLIACSGNCGQELPFHQKLSRFNTLIPQQVSAQSTAPLSRHSFRKFELYILAYFHLSKFWNQNSLTITGWMKQLQGVTFNLSNFKPLTSVALLSWYCSNLLFF